MLEILYRLQKVEATEAALLSRQKNSEQHRLLREMKADFEQQKQELDEMQQQLRAYRLEIDNSDNELREIETRLNQERALLYDGSVANMREMEARQAQIATLEEANAGLRTQLTQKRETQWKLMKQARKLRQRLTDMHQEFTEIYQKYEKILGDCQIQLDTLKEEKEALLALLNPQDLAWYEGQKPLFAGVPVAMLDTGHVCDGCRTMVTPMLYKRTVRGEGTRCEKCGRYLFVE